MNAADDFRALRHRVALLRERRSRELPAESTGAARMVGRVFDDGAMPSSVPGQFAVHPVSVGGPESEGAVPTLTPDADHKVIFTVLGPGVPQVGDNLVGRLVGARWVARRGGPRRDRTFKVKPLSCASLGTGGSFAYLYLPGARVVFTQGGTVLGDLVSDPAVDGGFVQVPCDSTQPLDVAVTAWRHQDYSHTFAAAPGTGSDAPVLHPAAGYGVDEAAVEYPLKAGLKLSDPYTTIDLTGAPRGTPESFYGCSLVWSGSYVRNVPVTGGGTGDVTFLWSLAGSTLTLGYRRAGGLVVRGGVVTNDMTAVADADPFGATGGNDFGLPQGDHMDVTPAVGLDVSGAINLRYGGDPAPGTYLNGTVRIWEP